MCLDVYYVQCTCIMYEYIRIYFIGIIRMECASLIHPLLFHLRELKTRRIRGTARKMESYTASYGGPLFSWMMALSSGEGGCPFLLKVSPRPNEHTRPTSSVQTGGGGKRYHDLGGPETWSNTACTTSCLMPGKLVFRIHGRFAEARTRLETRNPGGVPPRSFCVPLIQACTRE